MATSRLMSNAMSAMRRKGWIFSTTSRFITFAPHCVSWMFSQNNNLHDEMKRAAGEPAAAGLRLMNDRIRQPARADDAIRFADVLDQFQKRVRRRRAVGVHVADQIPVRRELEALDERAALADGLLEFVRADGGKFRRDLLDDAERVVRAAVEDDDDLEFAGIMRAKELRVIAQHRFDAALLVISRNQEQQAWVGHADSITENFRAGNLGKCDPACDCQHYGAGIAL